MKRAISFLIIATAVFVGEQIVSSPRVEPVLPAEDLSIAEAPVLPKDATMLFVGDIMLSRMVGARIIEKNDFRYPFLLAAHTLRSADLTFGNLEGPISRRGKNVGSIYSFRADPYVLEGISFAGFDALSVANNHAWDYGREAFLDTLELLDEKRIFTIGVGKDFTEAHAPKVLTAGDARVALLGYTDLVFKTLGNPESVPAIARPDIETIKTDIVRAKQEADLVVVSFHWGEEYQTKHNATQEALAHDAIDAGANIVVGHHPHVVQELEGYNGGYIAYSLGNFIFDQSFSEETMQGAALRVLLRGKGIAGAELVPIEINESFQPSFR
ncbi:MAG: CapA family protein [Patescibacteria group bacterium]